MKTYIVRTENGNALFEYQYTKHLKQLSYKTRSSEISIVYHNLLKSKIVVGVSLA